MTTPEQSLPKTTSGFYEQPQGTQPQPFYAHGQPIPYQMPPQHQQVIQVLTPKSPGLAAFLTFLWMGAGHLYTGAVGVGIALVLFELLVLTPLVFLFGLGVVLWFLTAPVAMFFAAMSATKFNQRNGIVVR